MSERRAKVISRQRLAGRCFAYHRAHFHLPICMRYGRVTETKTRRCLNIRANRDGGTYRGLALFTLASISEPAYCPVSVPNRIDSVHFSPVMEQPRQVQGPQGLAFGGFHIP